ncbi:MAG: serine/threonine-protein kinase [Isosphaeraceae bacterium]
MVRRFTEEAQIGGQLQHPGIVPIYELGSLDDRRPYFSMKLVKGQTLAALLEERHPEGHAADLPRFLAIFQAIAQTMAYAHARGVIHRDLKPSNVMVGSFGEVQVMDWGLAKVLGRPPVDDETPDETPRRDTVIATARSGSEADASHAGAVLGTPGYMSPEQARGENAQVDERADVFALGSILCEILTGKPAVVGRSTGEVIRTTALGDLADGRSRLEASGADDDLIALALRCLQREYPDRPRDARDVADRIAAHIDGVQERLNEAERERAVTQARAVEERKRRRLKLTLVATLMGSVALGIAGLAWTERQRARRLAETDRAVDGALAEAARAQAEAEMGGDLARWGEAENAARRAVGLVAAGEADATLRGRVEKAEREIAEGLDRAARQAHRQEAERNLMSRLESIRDARSEHMNPRRTDLEYAAAFAEAGLDLDATDPRTAARWIAGHPEPAELTAFLDDWGFVRILARRPLEESRRIFDAARAADPDPNRDALRDRLGDGKAANPAEFRRIADSHEALDALSSPGLIILARQLALSPDPEDHDRAERVLRRATAIRPGDVWAHYELGHLLESARPPRIDEAIGSYTTARVLRPATAHHLADLLMARGRDDEAELIFHDLLARRHGDPRDLLCCADLYKKAGRMAEAESLIERALEIARRDVERRPRDSGAHYRLGLALGRKGDLAGAIDAYRQVIRLRPDDPAGYLSLGNSLQALGQTEEAVDAYKQGLAIRPGDPRLRDALREIAPAHPLDTGPGDPNDGPP